jgi:hypothetical protein
VSTCPFYKSFKREGCLPEIGGEVFKKQNQNQIIMEHLLKHNSASMKTEVETFIIEETQELIYDNEKLDQWNKLVNELGLHGQTKVVVVDKSPIPFLWMNKALVATFTELCPRKVKVADYDKTPIPVEALSLVSLSIKENYFAEIQVWYNDKNPDPAIIGKMRNKDFDPKYPTWESGFDYYLLARWSDVKASLEELTERAKKLFILRRKNEVGGIIKKYQRDLDDVEQDANNLFGFGGTESNSIDIPF